MAGADLTAEQQRVLLAVAASGFAGTDAAGVVERSGLDKAVVMDAVAALWDGGLIEQVAGIRAAYRATGTGRDLLDELDEPDEHDDAGGPDAPDGPG